MNSMGDEPVPLLRDYDRDCIASHLPEGEKTHVQLSSHALGHNEGSDEVLSWGLPGCRGWGSAWGQGSLFRALKHEQVLCRPSEVEGGHCRGRLHH